jgi:hypothetical protein
MTVDPLASPSLVGRRACPRLSVTARLLALLLLFRLYLIARLMVGAAVLNATLWDRELRSRTAS